MAPFTGELMEPFHTELLVVLYTVVMFMYVIKRTQKVSNSIHDEGK